MGGRRAGGYSKPWALKRTMNSKKMERASSQCRKIAKFASCVSFVLKARAHAAKDPRWWHRNPSKSVLL